MRTLAADLDISRAQGEMERGYLRMWVGGGVGRGGSGGGFSEEEGRGEPRLRGEGGREACVLWWLGMGGGVVVVVGVGVLEGWRVVGGSAWLTGVASSVGWVGSVGRVSWVGYG
jgi:hypothetical protein